MRFIKDTLSYLKSAFWVAALVAAVPSILLGLFVKPMSTLTFLTDYYRMEIGGFFDIYKLMIVDRGFDTVWIALLVLVTLLIYFSVSLAMIEKHMRTGRLTARRLVADLNNNIISTVMSLVAFGIFLAVVQVLLSSVLTLLHSIVGTHTATPKPMDCVYATIIALIAFGAMIRVVVEMMFWGPVMQVYGYTFRDAIIETSHITDKNTLTIYIGLLVPCLIVAIIEFVFCLLPLSGAGIHIVQVVVNSILHMAVIIYVPAYIMNALFSITELERRDTKKLY